MDTLVDATGGAGTSWADYLGQAALNELGYRQELRLAQLKYNSATAAPGTDGQRTNQNGVIPQNWMMPAMIAAALVGVYLIVRR